MRRKTTIVQVSTENGTPQTEIARKTGPLGDPHAQKTEPMAVPPPPPELKPEAETHPDEQYRLDDFPIVYKAILAGLAVILLVSSSAALILATTLQYRGALQLQSRIDKQSTASAMAQSQATVNVINTAQARIIATATTQAGVVVTATANAAESEANASRAQDDYRAATKGTATFTDNLSDATGTGRWDQGTADVGTGCAFSQGSYQISVAQQGYLQPCLARSTDFQNFAYQVNMTLVTGSQAGLIFRSNNGNNSFYFFRVGTTGTYALDLYKNTTQAQTLASGYNTNVPTGMKQSIHLAVLAKGDTFQLFVNEQYIASITDKNLSSGMIGLAAVNSNLPTLATFTTAQVWKLP